MRTQITRWIPFIALFIPLLASSSSKQDTQDHEAPNADLKFVVYLSRHGVRSPTGNPEQYNSYSAAPWPAWSVAPGYLTAHGYHLMEIFGAYDRMQLASEGLLSANGCEDANLVTIQADSDQRTRETGKALAAGLFPGCAPNIKTLPEGVADPLFHSLAAGVGHFDSGLEIAAIEGRIGNSPDHLTEAYRSQIVALDTILTSCGAADPAKPGRISLLDIPATLTPGRGDHAVDMKGPLNTASTLAENLLLEYTEGMDASKVGWGCVDGAKLRSIIDLHTAATEFTQRTPGIARMQASNLVDHIRRALEQAVTGKPIADAPGKPADRALFLIGHDTNLANVAGLLNLNWIADGRRDDTPPGAAVIFELWKIRTTGSYIVRAYYTAQTIEQMRLSSNLTMNLPPQRVPLFIPGCSRQNFSCSWESFQKTLNEAVDSNYVVSVP